MLVAGRCFSADREALGSARVIGGCLAMGQAAGTAASMLAASNLEDVRQLDVSLLRKTLEITGCHC